MDGSGFGVYVGASSVDYMKLCMAHHRGVSVYSATGAMPRGEGAPFLWSYTTGYRNILYSLKKHPWLCDCPHTLPYLYHAVSCRTSLIHNSDLSPHF